MAGLFGLSSIGKAMCSTENGRYNNIDECKRYKTGKNDDTKHIGTKIEKTYYNGKIFRTGCKCGKVPINDGIIDYEDVCFLDADLTFYDILEPLKEYSFDDNLSADQIVRALIEQYDNRMLLNNQGVEEQMRYNHKCIDTGYDYKLTVGTLKKCKFYDKKATKCKLSNKDNNDIVNGYKKYLENKIEKIKNDNNIKTIALKYINDRGKNGDYAFPVVAKDLKSVFLKMMDTGKNIYIKEHSCYYSEDFPKLILELLNERSDYNGKFILERNAKYNKVVDALAEVNFVFDKNKNLEGLKSNKVLQNSEFILFDRTQIKCLTENEARETLGGSYLKNKEINDRLNITYANKVGKHCIKKIKKYYNTYLKKPLEEKIYDDPITKGILNEEAKENQKKQKEIVNGDL